MHVLKYILLVVLSFVAGSVVTSWVDSKFRMQDEFVYALRVSNSIYHIENEKSYELKKELENSLFFHFNRLLVARSYTPNFLVSEEEDWVCSSFNLTNPDNADFRSILEKESLYEYIEDRLSKICPWGRLYTHNE